MKTGLVLLVALLLAGNRILVATMARRALRKMAEQGTELEPSQREQAERQIRLSILVASLWAGVGTAAVVAGPLLPRVLAGVALGVAAWFALRQHFSRP